VLLRQRYETELPQDAQAEWFLPQINCTLPGIRPLTGGDYVVTTAPYTGAAGLYLKKM
jgi:hypothetical protein